jgi:hypothetical protein
LQVGDVVTEGRDEEVDFRDSGGGLLADEPDFGGEVRF